MKYHKELFGLTADASQLIIKSWGSAFFDCLSLDLKTEFPGQTVFSVTNIKYAKRWYEFYHQVDINRQRVVDDFNSEDFNEPESSNLQRVVEDFEMPTNFGLIP